MSVLDEFITHYAVEVTRVAEGSISNVTGLWVDGVSSTLNVDMCIQPVNQRERLLLPETVRTSEIIKVYHAVPLNITDDRANIKADTFAYNGNKYAIFSTANWNDGEYDIKYYKSFAVMIDKDGSYVK